jgi:hypothetical protein
MSMSVPLNGDSLLTRPQDENFGILNLFPSKQEIVGETEWQLNDWWDAHCNEGDHFS